jgi:hypothetical protein
MLDKEELLTFWEEIRTNQIILKEMAHKFELEKSLLSDENFKNLETITTALKALNRKAAQEFQVQVAKIDISFNKSSFEKNLVKKITDKLEIIEFDKELVKFNNDTKQYFANLMPEIKKLAPKLEQGNKRIITNLENVNDSIENINNWLFVGGIALGGLTVELYNLLRGM